MIPSGIILFKALNSVAILIVLDFGWPGWKHNLIRWSIKVANWANKLIPEFPWPNPFFASCNIAAAASLLEDTLDFETAAVIHNACWGYSLRTEVIILLTTWTTSSFWWQILETNWGRTVNHWYVGKSFKHPLTIVNTCQNKREVYGKFCFRFE